MYTFLFWRIFDSIVLGDFLFIMRIYLYLCPTPTLHSVRPGFIKAVLIWLLPHPLHPPSVPLGMLHQRNTRLRSNTLLTVEGVGEEPNYTKIGKPTWSALIIHNYIFHCVLNKKQLQQILMPPL
jgi:hypothetical protein